MDYRADIQALHPRISWAVVEQTEIGAIPWQRAAQAESGRDEFARDTEPFCIGSKLKLGAGEPRAVHRCRQFAKIAVTKNRRVENVDRFVVETFENCACKIFVGIDDQDDRAQLTRSWRRTTDNQTGDIVLNNELRAEEGCDRPHINMPPIRAERQALDPFRTVNGPVRPFIGDLRVEVGISYNAIFRTAIGLVSKWIEERCGMPCEEAGEISDRAGA